MGEVFIGASGAPVKQAQPVFVVTRANGVEASATGGGDASAANQTALNALVGEVQASPTSNTVLDRLKSLATLVTATNAKDFATQTTLASLLAAQGGQRTVVVTLAMTVAATLAAGDCMGGKLVFATGLAAGTPCEITSLVFFADANGGPQVVGYVFEADPSASTLTDDAPLVIATADRIKIAKAAAVTAGSPSTGSTGPFFAAVISGNIPVGAVIGTGGNLWVAFSTSTVLTLVANTHARLTLRY